MSVALYRIGSRVHIIENWLDLEDDGVNITINRVNGTSVTLTAQESEAVRWWAQRNTQDVVQAYNDAIARGEL